MTDFRKVTTLEDLWSGEMASFQVDGCKVLVVRLGDEVFAYEDRCAHLGVPLSQGRLERGVLTCRAHHFQYDAATGCGLNPANVRLTGIPVQVRDGEVRVAVSEKAERR